MIPFGRSGKRLVHLLRGDPEPGRRSNTSRCRGPYACLPRRPCVSPIADVYLGMTTTMAIAEPTDLAYERAFEEHWTDVFRFALAWKIGRAHV